MEQQDVQYDHYALSLKIQALIIKLLSPLQHELFQKNQLQRTTQANTTMINISLDEIFNNLFNTGVAFLAMMKNNNIYPSEIKMEIIELPSDVASPKTRPDTTERYTARNISSNMTIPRINSVPP